MSNPPAGWYPAPHANNENRYWDGSRWIEPAQAQAATPPSGPKRKGLGIAALILGIVAFLCGWIPVVGIVLGITALVLGIIALVRKQPKVFGITAIILGTIAVIVSIVTTVSFGAFMANQPEPATAPTPVASQPADEETVEENAPEPIEAATPEAPPVPTTPDLATFTETDDRNWALIAKDPDSYSGTNLILYGSIMQFDSATGRCSMLIDTAATLKEMSFEYEQSVMAYSGDASTNCPAFDPLVEDDNVKIWATVEQSFSYDTQIGGNTTVPMIKVWQAELLPATEY